jgi:hypothetical protein
MDLGLQDLASGYMSGKLLLKLEATSFILTHHTRDHFAFLDDPANARNRTTFYYTLARLLFMEDTPSKFKAFMDPLNQVGSFPRAPPHFHLSMRVCLCVCPCICMRAGACVDVEYVNFFLC